MRLKDQETNQIYLWGLGFIPAFIIILFILLFGIYLTSAYFVMSPRLAMDEWSCSGRTGNEDVWQAELNKLFFAKKLDPWNAAIYMDIGRMYEWKALSGAAWNSATKEARFEASSYFKLAVERRPTWALAWANYAQSQLLNRVLDDEVFTAISKGFKFGRWQKETQKKLLWLSVGIWQRLPENIRQQVREQIIAMQSQPRSMDILIKIAVRFQWFDELIPLLKNDQQRERIESIRTQPNIMRNVLQGNARQQAYICRVSEI